MNEAISRHSFLSVVRASALAVAFAPLVVQAAETYYASPTGKDDAAGSYEEPLSVQAAIAKTAGQRNVNIILRKGEYRFEGCIGQADSRIDGGTLSYCMSYNPIDCTISGETDNPADTVLIGPEGNTTTRAIGFCAASPVSLNNLTFTNFHSSSKGGAVFTSTHNTLNISNCHFYCNAASNGGAVQSGATFTDCLFEGNSATANGGAVNGAKLCVLCVFKKNTAANSGAFYNGAATSCEFIENEANEYGAMFVSGGALTDCVFRGNVARTGNAGAVHGFKTLSGCWFYGNTAKKQGGAIYNFTAPATLTDCHFFNNKAGEKGGAVGYAMNTTFIDCEMIGNEAPEASACVYGSHVRGIFERNVGAEVAVYGVNGGIIALEKCRVVGNVSTNGSVVNYANATQCLIVSNKTVATDKAIVGYSTLTQCTVADNTAPGGGCIGYSSTLVNTILSGNDPIDFRRAVTANNTLYSTVYPGMTITGDNNVPSVTAGFNAGKDQKSPYYALRKDSPARNVGQMLTWTADDADLEGRPRINAEGKVDLGCYAYVPLSQPGLMLLLR